MMVFLKAKSKLYQHMQAFTSLHVINMLIIAVEIDGFAKIDFGETPFFNGSIQIIYHAQRH